MSSPPHRNRDRAHAHALLAPQVSELPSGSTCHTLSSLRLGKILLARVSMGRLGRLARTPRRVRQAASGNMIRGVREPLDICTVGLVGERGAHI